MGRIVTYFTFIVLAFLANYDIYGQKIGLDSLSKLRIDAPTAKDTAFGMKAKKIVPKKLYGVLFRNLYNSTNSEGQVSEIEENPHKAYAGRWIRKIYILPLDVFGYSVYDTTRSPRSWIDRAGNGLHRTTRDRIVRRNFLFFDGLYARFMVVDTRRLSVGT